MSKQGKTGTEQLILEAAEQEFFTKGYDGARTTSIAEKAGVTHAMLHYYFRTKEQLFERIVAKNVSLIAETMFAKLGNPDKPLIERLKDGIAAHFDLIATNELLPRFFLNEIISRPEKYDMIYKNLSPVALKLLADTQREIDDAADRGDMEWIDAKMLLLSVFSLNVFTFIVYPFIESMWGDLMSDRGKFLAERKAENIETIMRRIKKI